MRRHSCRASDCRRLVCPNLLKPQQVFVCMCVRDIYEFTCSMQMNRRHIARGPGIGQKITRAGVEGVESDSKGPLKAN